MGVTMVNRINEILKRYNLSAAKFADKLGVPRSTISHILSERNKPSLEFIQKVLTQYPEISTTWLIKGEGSFYKKGEPDLFSQLQEVNVENRDQFKEDETSNEHDTSFQEENIAENKTQTDNRSEKRKYQNLSEIKNTDKKPEVVENVKDDEKLQGSQNSNKKVKKIIVFYSDNTFEEFSPSQSNTF